MPAARVDQLPAKAESDQTRTVGADRRVVPRHPEATRCVAPPVRQLRQEDRAARVELGLQEIGVVAHAGAGGCTEAEERERNERRK